MCKCHPQSLETSREDDNVQVSVEDGYLVFFSAKNKRNQTHIFRFVCTTVLYKFLKSPRNDVHNLSSNIHVQRKIHQELYQSIVCVYIYIYI